MNKLTVASLSALLSAQPVLSALVPVAPVEGTEVPLVPAVQRQVMALGTLEERLGLFAEDKKNDRKLRMSKDWRRAEPLVLSWRVTEGEKGPWKIELGKAADLSDARAWYLTDAMCGGSNCLVRTGLVARANLELGATYFWRVSRRDRCERWNCGANCSCAESKRVRQSAVSRFRTADLAPRWIEIEGRAGNMRDLGGRIGFGGRRVRQGLVFRGEGLNDNSMTGETRGSNRLMVEDVDYLTDTLGIRTDLDLRSPAETAGATGSPMGPKVRFLHIPTESYREIFKPDGMKAMAQAFRVFCDRKNYPVYFHCIAGADRTGALAYVLNGILGVSRHELEADWESSFYPRIPDADSNPDFWRRESHFNDGFAKFGGPEATWNDRIALYLKACGITDEEIATVREILLERVAEAEVLGGKFADESPRCAVSTVVETTVRLKTYPFSDPDPVPATGLTRYPYFFIDGTSAAAEMRDWKAVVLENENVRVTILPEIGGKVWGAVDKKTGREFIYYNHVVKFRNISQRGPWCSGGIEFNFGIIGHGPWTATPVSYFTRTNPDGSASCFLAESEYATRTDWQVEVRLPAEADGFLTRTTWFNASGFPAPYYQWMNAAYSVRGTPTFEFPGKSYIGHSGDTHAWPVDPDGNVLDTFSGNAFGGPKSYHVLEGDNGFYGIWWSDWNIGSAHLNHVTQKYGRKVWLWSQSRNGAIWEDLLTDEDGQYTELQSGRVFNQPSGDSSMTPFKHPTFAAGTTDAFEEEWRVVRDRSFFDRRLVAQACVSRPQTAPSDFDWKSAYGLSLAGEQLLRQLKDREGEAKLLRSLEKEPNFVPSLNLLATLAVRRGEYAKARMFAARALAVNTYEAEANYADGMAALASGDVATAKERLGLAAYSPNFRAAAFTRVAMIDLAEGRLAEAEAIADKALQADALNRDARLVKVVAARKGGDLARAKALATALLVDLPLCHAARYELNRADTASEPFTRYVRNELPQETYLSIGTWYEDAGQLEDAERFFALAAERTPVGGIRRAYVLDTLGRRDEAAEALAAVERQTIAFALPFRRETLPALDWAVARSPAWKFRYLRGVLLASFARDAEADADLSSCGETPDDSVFYLYRALRRTGDERLADLRRARRSGDSWRVGLAASVHFSSSGKWAAALAELEPYVRRRELSNKLSIAYATALVKNGRNREAVAFLENTVFLPSEGGDNAGGVWIAAWRALAEDALAKGDEAGVRAAVAKAISFPERLGLGRPYVVDFTAGPFADWPEELRRTVRELERTPPPEKNARELFNGRDLTGWYTYLQGKGRNVDPDGVFTVTNGVIRVSGRGFGALVSEEEFSDYRLRVEYRFLGGEQFGWKKGWAPDSGILFHSTGPDGAFDGTWMESLELNLIKGATGDFWGVAAPGRDTVALSCRVGERRHEGKYAVYDPAGADVFTITGNTRVCRCDLDPAWRDRYETRIAANERPIGEWNVAELICLGDKVTAIFNGKVVNCGFGAKPSRGRIQLQTEGCPIEFRRVTLTKER